MVSEHIEETVCSVGCSSRSLVLYLGEQEHLATFKWLVPAILEKDSGGQH